MTDVRMETAKSMEHLPAARGDTWPKVLKYNCETYGGRRRAMRHKHFGIWQPFTWEDYYLSVKKLSLGLLALGMRPGDKVLIMGDNAPQWYYAELAVQANHGAAVGMFSDLAPAEIKAIAGNTVARFAVIEGQEQADKFLQIAAGIPQLEKIVYWNSKGLVHYDSPLLVGWQQVIERGEAFEAGHPGCFEQNVGSGRSEEVCAVVYTAGTTGSEPKGAVHTYRTLRAGADYLLDLDPWTPEDNVVPYLPPVWIQEQWMAIGCHLLSGGILNLAEAPETHRRDSRETGPSIVFNRARIWESLAAGVQARILDADPVKRWAFRHLMPIGYGAAESRQRGLTPGPLKKAADTISEMLLFGSIKRSLGLSNARICYSSGGILSPDALRFYHALNVPLKSLYATTEGGVLSGARGQDIRLETLGPARRDAEVRIGPGGEIITRQPGTFLGYCNDPQKTSEALENGWFHSGDGGLLRDDGQLVFLDRIQDLARLADGTKLAPQLLEGRLRASPYIRDAWVLTAAGAAAPAAVIVINGEAVGRWAGRHKVAFASFAELSQAPEVYGLVRKDIERINRDLPQGARVDRFVNLHQEFDPDESEVTRTRNLRRDVLGERYRPLLEAIAAGAAEVGMEARSGHRDGLTGPLRTTLRIASIQGAGG
jgi:long-chain acyl-CoA synthetase